MGKDGTSNVSYTLNCRLLFGESPSNGFNYQIFVHAEGALKV